MPNSARRITQAEYDALMGMRALTNLPPNAVRPDAMHLEMMAQRQNDMDRQLQAIREMAAARQRQQLELALELQRLELMRQRQSQ